MRSFVFQIFARIFATAVLAVLIFLVTVGIRGGFSVLYQFSTHGLPVIGQTLLSDPWYVVALILAMLLVWSWPWETESQDRSPVRRGRVVSDYSRVARRAPAAYRGPSAAVSKIRR